MTRFTVTKGAGMLLEGLGEEESKAVKEALTVKPIEHPSYKNDADSVAFPVYHGDLVVPKFWGMEWAGVAMKVPLTGVGMDPSVEFRGSLREPQVAVVDMVDMALKEKGGGILSLPCGHGKTCVAIYVAALLRVPTLVLVHKQFLMDQWVESIEKFVVGARVGTIQRDKVDIEGKDFVIGMIQSISMKEYPPEVLSGFDLLIVDEVHNVATKVFSRALAKIQTTYTLGLSATPDRDDGLSKVFYWYLGPMIHRAEKAKDPRVVVHLVPFTLDPKTASPRDLYRFREVRNYRGDVNLSQMISNIGELAPRNRLITGILVSVLKKDPARCCLILSSRIGQLEELRAMFEAAWEAPPSSSLYIGKMKAAQLKAAQECQVLFATYEMVNEGFDLPKLNTLLFASPRSKIEQAVGRILRQKDPNHPPVVVDIVDALAIFKGQGYKRRRYYKGLDYKISEGAPAAPAVPCRGSTP